MEKSERAGGGSDLSVESSSPALRSAELSGEIERCLKLEFDDFEFGLSPIEPTELSMSSYAEWLLQEGHADMMYMADHFKIKKDPQSHYPGFRLVISVLVPYVPRHPFATQMPEEICGLKIARYAQGTDYHLAYKAKLKRVADELQALFPDQQFLPLVDSSPLPERDYAYQSGLGWFGKNSMLISRRLGSFTLLGEILSTQDINDWTQTPGTAVSKSPDFCGKCTLCVDSCPTDAIDPVRRTVNSGRCISYWTIESKSDPPPSLAQNFQGWAFGCDICNEVCPWNLKIQRLSQLSPGSEGMATQGDLRKKELESLRWILQSSPSQIQKRLKGLALSRSAGWKLKRNALIVIQNQKHTELLDLVVACKGQPRLATIAAWVEECLLRKKLI